MSETRLVHTNDDFVFQWMITDVVELVGGVA